MVGLEGKFFFSPRTQVSFFLYQNIEKRFNPHFCSSRLKLSLHQFLFYVQLCAVISKTVFYGRSSSKQPAGSAAVMLVVLIDTSALCLFAALCQFSSPNESHKAAGLLPAGNSSLIDACRVSCLFQSDVFLKTSSLQPKQSCLKPRQK